MAIHDFECPQCGERSEDVFLSFPQIREPDLKQWCPKCGQSMVQSFNNFRGFPPFRPYVDQHIAETPVEITSREQRRDLMKKNNLVDHPAGQGEPGCMV